MPDFDSFNHDKHNKKSRKLAYIGISLAIVIGAIAICFAYFSTICLENELKDFLWNMDLKNDAYIESIYCKIENPDEHCNIKFEQIIIKENHWCLDPIGKRFVAVTTTNSSITDYYP